MMEPRRCRRRLLAASLAALCQLLLAAETRDTPLAPSPPSPAERSRPEHMVHPGMVDGQREGSAMPGRPTVANGRPTAMLRGDAHLREKQEAREQRVAEAGDWFTRSGGDMQTLLGFQAQFMIHLKKERESDPELSPTSFFKRLDTDHNAELSAEDGGMVAEMLGMAGHQTPVSYEHFKRLPAVSQDSREHAHKTDSERMKKGPGKLGAGRGWADLLKPDKGKKEWKDGALKWHKDTESGGGGGDGGGGGGGGKKMGNEDMHRADAPLTSAQVEQVRSRLRSKVAMLEHKQQAEGGGGGGGGVDEQLGVVQDAIEGLKHPGLDRAGLKSLLEGVRCVRAMRLTGPLSARLPCLPS